MKRGFNLLFRRGRHSRAESGSLQANADPHQIEDLAGFLRGRRISGSLDVVTPKRIHAWILDGKAHLFQFGCRSPLPKLDTFPLRR